MPIFPSVYVSTLFHQEATMVKHMRLPDLSAVGSIIMARHASPPAAWDPFALLREHCSARLPGTRPGWTAYESSTVYIVATVILFMRIPHLIPCSWNVSRMTHQQLICSCVWCHIAQKPLTGAGAQAHSRFLSQVLSNIEKLGSERLRMRNTEGCRYWRQSLKRS